MLPSRSSCPYRVDVDLWNEGPRQGLSVTLWNPRESRRSAFHWHSALGWLDGSARRPLRECAGRAARYVLDLAPDPEDLDLLEGQLSDPYAVWVALSVMES